MAHITVTAVQCLFSRRRPGSVVREKCTARGDIVEEYSDRAIRTAPASICVDVLYHGGRGAVSVSGVHVSKDLDVGGLQLWNAALVIRVRLRVGRARTTGWVDDDEECE